VVKLHNQKSSFDPQLLKYLRLLATKYPTINAASTEIINLQAILNLPKGTEHFVSDIHGAYDPFNHVLRNVSGVIKNYIEEIFGNTLRESEKKSLATLIYYPKHKVKITKLTEPNMADWYRITLFRLIQVCKRASSKYSRSKVRKALPKDFSYVLEELLQEEEHTANKQGYYNEIIDTIVKLGRAEEFIVAISDVTCHLAIDMLHILGDIYDRGPDPDKIMDILKDYHSLDIQWGNHDMLWMGAASGSEACILNVIRISARYDNLNTLEDGYGINLVPLATFAIENYSNDPCLYFQPKTVDGYKPGDIEYQEKEGTLISKIHKAAAILQFKIEGHIIRRNPDFNMDNRLLLDKIDYDKSAIAIEGKEYPLLDGYFPTIDPKDPYALTVEEKNLINKLQYSFQHSQKLQEHTRILFSKGDMYKIFNSNLMFHGCLPMDESGALKRVKLKDQYYSGKSLLDILNIKAREGYFHNDDSKKRQEGQDLMWYLWCGPDSPLFGKNKMTTFERYFIADKSLHKEVNSPYFEKRNDKEICCDILRQFGLEPEGSHIINGHVPVKVKKGESPIKADGMLLNIDGGFSRAYQEVTGIAGYTLIYNSHGLMLTSHEPFVSTEDAIKNERDIVSQTVAVEKSPERIKIMDTDKGNELKSQAADLEKLLEAYRKGLIPEQI